VAGRVLSLNLNPRISGRQLWSICFKNPESNSYCRRQPRHHSE